MRVHIAIDGATYRYDDLDGNQFDAIVKLLESMSSCTLYPTGPLALADEYLSQSGKSYACMLEQKLTEKDNEIARLTKSRDDALAKLDNRALRQEIERILMEVSAERQGEPQQAPTLEARIDEQDAEISRMRDELGRRHRQLVAQETEIKRLHAIYHTIRATP